ncbi:glycosyltransferase [Flavobacterium sp. MAH-1]|uniref:Glycosyltransferase n=1 Tax=Flavobacterium agri TaxID=2743471 RepID=A0A7Y8Y4N4_9FLAO|nr:glycosyltransferase [Flavobacterium agri]NUY82271.1 glycosyltransferase [Flavobacterium agri]NYA72295.1 glycosyltransferase [Flavobacterium agri]
MKPFYFSVIVPVYNRPDEMQEFLESLAQSTFAKPFEVVIVEDGSSIPCKHVAESYSSKLQISYYFKPNSGPGDSRNFGMEKAVGDYFLIFDSDCLIPKEYLSIVDTELEKNYVDCFGGPDAAHPSFSDIQKAINFAMTSIMTTGGIRGGSETVDKFQPRSFNMGLSRKAFESSGGFGDIHPGEDPDLSIRLWEMGFKTRLFSRAYVFHKRRIDWNKFYKQVNKFGKARPILDSWYPKYAKLTFFAPTVFVLGAILAVLLAFFGIWHFVFAYVFYFAFAFILSASQNNLKIGAYSIVAIAIQFYGYGVGFLKSFVNVRLLKRKPQTVFPELFFKK